MEFFVNPGVEFSKPQNARRRKIKELPWDLEAQMEAIRSLGGGLRATQDVKRRKSRYKEFPQDLKAQTEVFRG